MPCLRTSMQMFSLCSKKSPWMLLPRWHQCALQCPDQTQWDTAWIGVWVCVCMGKRDDNGWWEHFYSFPQPGPFFPLFTLLLLFLLTLHLASSLLFALFFPKHCWWLRESCALQLCHQGRPSEDRLWRGFPSPRYPPNGDKPSSCIVTSQKHWHNRSLSSIYTVPRLLSPVPHGNTLPSPTHVHPTNACSILYSLAPGYYYYKY